jgi:hypothetical protein
MLRHIFILIVCITPLIGNCYDQFEAGRSAGMYITASDILIKLKQSKCGYVIKRPVKNIDEVTKEIFSYLNKSDHKAFIEYLNSAEFKTKLQKNNQLINQAISTTNSATDPSTGCGLAVGSLLNVVKTGEDAWRTQIKKH